MNSLRILITNNTLDARAGSELYVRDLALALLKRGHQPIAYSPRLGAVAAELRAATVPVIDNLAALGVAPDLIHGQHHLETMTALLRFPNTPALHYCHGWLPWEETPLRHPRILRYVAVDQVCRERLIAEGGIAPARVVQLLNFVDLARFQPRAPLPPKPQRALFFSNYVGESPQLRAVREACSQAGLSLEVMGLTAGAACAQPENELGKYDLVFAKARSALEALAIGNAVILCDPTSLTGFGGMVTSAELDRWRPLNFGIRTITQPLTSANVLAAIQSYDASDALRVSAAIRATASLDEAVTNLIALYHEVIAEHVAATEPSYEAAARAEATYLRWLSSRFGEWSQLKLDAHQVSVELAAARAEFAAAQTTLALFQTQAQQLQSERDQALSARDYLQGERDQALSERAQALNERDQAQSERAQALSERDQAISERDQAISMRDQAQSARDQAQSQRDRMQSERDQAQSRWEAWQNSRTGRLALLLNRIKRF